VAGGNLVGVVAARDWGGGGVGGGAQHCGGAVVGGADADEDAVDGVSELRV